VTPDELATRHPSTVTSGQHDPQVHGFHHHVEAFSTLNAISCPTLNFVPKRLEPVHAEAATATTERMTTRTHPSLAHFFTTLTSYRTSHYTPGCPPGVNGGRRLLIDRPKDCERDAQGIVRVFKRPRRKWEALGAQRTYLSREPARRVKGEWRTMVGKDLVDKLSIYIPQKRLEEKPVERLIKLGKRRDRSVNYLVVEAILQYLSREEHRS